MPLSQMVKSYKFWDVVVFRSKERLEHEDMVARALARGIICDDLKFQSADPKWFKGKEMELRGYPYVEYFAKPGESMVILNAETLEHLLSIARKAKTPSREKLQKEFVLRNDFKKWLEETGQLQPVFWFAEKE